VTSGLGHMPNRAAHYYSLVLLAYALHYRAPIRGRYGFDDGNETCGACRDGSQSRKSKAANY